MAKRLTDEQRELVLALYKAGKEPKEICAIVGCGDSTVHNIRAAAGVELHRKPHSYSAIKSRESEDKPLINNSADTQLEALEKAVNRIELLLSDIYDLLR